MPIADSGAPIRGKSGQLHGTVLVFATSLRATARKALLRAKETAEAADRLKSEFVATISHELRTPLNVILGYTDMLIEDSSGDLPLPQGEILRRIQRNAQVLHEMISMVLDLNRLEARRLPVDVKEVQITEFLAEVQTELQGFCEQSGLAWRWEVAAELPPFRTDAGKLKSSSRTCSVMRCSHRRAGDRGVAARQGDRDAVTDTDWHSGGGAELHL